VGKEERVWSQRGLQRGFGGKTAVSVFFDWRWIEGGAKWVRSNLCNLGGGRNRTFVQGVGSGIGAALRTGCVGGGGESIAVADGSRIHRLRGG